MKLSRNCAQMIKKYTNNRHFIFFKLLLLTFLILPKTLYSQEKIAIVLSGGGAQGIAHIGVLKAFEEYKIPIDLIVGSSAGSLVAGLYASGVSVDQMEQMVHNGSISSLFMGRRKPIDYPIWERQKNQLGNLSVGWDDRQFVGPASLLNDWLIEKELFNLTAPAQAFSKSNFDSLLIPFRTVAADLTNKKSYLFKSGSLPQAMKASMSVPVIYSPVILNNRMLVDGGIYMKMPVAVAIDEGADFIIAVNTEDVPQNLDELNDVFDYFDELNRRLLSSGDSSDVKGWDYFFRVDTRGHHLMDFAGGPDLLKLGYIAGVKAAKELQSRLQRQLNVEEFKSRQKIIYENLNKKYFPIEYINKHHYSNIASDVSRLQLPDSIMFSSREVDRIINILLSTNNYETVIPTFSHDSKRIQFYLNKKSNTSIQTGLDINSYEGFNVLLEMIVKSHFGNINLNTMSGNSLGTIDLVMSPPLYRLRTTRLIDFLMKPTIRAKHQYHHINLAQNNLKLHQLKNTDFNIGLMLVPGWNRQLTVAIGVRNYFWSATDSTRIEKRFIPSRYDNYQTLSLGFYENHILKKGLNPIGWRFEIVDEHLKKINDVHEIIYANSFVGLHYRQNIFFNFEIDYQKTNSDLPFGAYGFAVVTKASKEKYPLYLLAEETLNVKFNLSKTLVRKDILLGFSFVQSFPKRLYFETLNDLAKDGLTGVDISLSYDSILGPISIGWSFSEIEHYQPSSWASVNIRL
jgi:predicted acylesterase/phospholipase RssA